MSNTTVLWVVALLAAFFVIYIFVNHQERKALQRAYEDYQSALSTLKAIPASADLRQDALALGRTYSNLTRKKKGVTVYDEVALMNDLNAATGGVTPGTVAAPAEISIETRLNRLDDLRATGMITDREFENRRQKIIDEL